MNEWERLNSELADARHYADDMKERVTQLEGENTALRQQLGTMVSCGEYFACWLIEDIAKDTPQYPTFEQFLDRWECGDLVEWKAKIDKMYADAGEEDVA